MKWAPKRNRDGQVQQNCWITDSGYTVAECRLPEARYPITRQAPTCLSLMRKTGTKS